jgi:hypothetical protein
MSGLQPPHLTLLTGACQPEIDNPRPEAESPQDLVRVIR